ncbi:methionyl-tRNA formyltransferase [Brevibacterium litoralis]|uniref:methionyl-tRNA formyltransferase n=1 Tax=Brevibacterium litoralis TaxID=3138935 RepID=UPI0032EFC601
MRILFAGTPAVAVPSLDALLTSGHEVVAVLTRPDAPVGRKRVLTPSPVKTRAIEAGLPVIEADRLRGEVLSELEALDLDAVAVVAYGALAGPRALAAVRHGWFNLHFSLLPDWRGAAPLQRAIMAGQDTSGVTVFRLDTGMDTGDVVLRREFDLPEVDAGAALEDYAHRGAPVLVEALDAVAAETATFEPQPAAGTHAEKILPAEARLDFALSAQQVSAHARGVSPAPGPWAELDGKRTKLAGIRVAHDVTTPGVGVVTTATTAAGDPTGETVVIGCAEGAVSVERIQPSGKPMTDAPAFLRGRQGTVTFDPAPADSAPDATLAAEAPTTPAATPTTDTETGR